jgi:acyl carrier protein
MELAQIRELALQAFVNLKEELEVTIDIEIDDATNVLELLDSMDIVNLIMETESLVEAELGNYVALANEATFDADGSPLLSFGTWVSYIVDMCELSHDS